MSGFFTPTVIWLIVAIFLIAAEIFLPGAVIGIVGFSALIVSGLSWIGLVNSFLWQMLIFIALTALFIFIFFKFLKKILYKTDSDDSNSYIEIGKIIPVIEEINSSTGKGKVRYMGAQWKAVSETDIKSGESVRVVGNDNLTIRVEPLKSKNKN